MAVVMSERDGHPLERQMAKELLESSLSSIHIDAGNPKAIWTSSSDKEEDDNPIAFPVTDNSECIAVEDVFLDGVKLEKHHLSKLTEINNDSASTS